MKVIKTFRKLCLCCMEEHDVQIIEVLEKNYFKGQEVEYNATYLYCDKADEYVAEEDMILQNDIAMKEAYRKKNHLLTAKEIEDIRNKYCISQKDLACVLGWGEKTITRYEGHQVQDKAHDYILRKIDDDPEWFLELLQNGRKRVTKTVYEKYYQAITREYAKVGDSYLKKSILAQYILYKENPDYQGNVELNFDKVKDSISYLASLSNKKELDKKQVMRLLWYADSLSHKRYNYAITGLVYIAKKKEIVSVAQESIMELNHIPFDERSDRDFKFIGNSQEHQSLTTRDKEVLRTIFKACGEDTCSELDKRIQKEKLYQNTEQGAVITFEHSQELSLV